MLSLNLHVGERADGKGGKQKGKRTGVLYHISCLFLWWEHTFMPASQNTNAKEIYKPIRGS